MEQLLLVSFFFDFNQKKNNPGAEVTHIFTISKINFLNIIEQLCIAIIMYRMYYIYHFHLDLLSKIVKFNEFFNHS